MVKRKPQGDTPARTCGAKTNAGTPCQRAPMQNGRCYIHGGKTPRGVASPNFKHGRYSKSIPARLSERYEEALHDAERLILDDEIAVTIARNHEILSRLYSGDGENFRMELLRTLTDHEEERILAQEAHEQGDTEAEAEHSRRAVSLLNKLFRTIKRGASDVEVWRERDQNVEQLRKLAESERKRKIEEQQMATLEEVMAMMGAVLAIITRHVPDPHIRQAIGTDIEALVASGEEFIVDAEVVE